MTLDDLRGRLFVNPSQAAEILGLDPRSVRRSVQRGEIPGVKIGARMLIPVKAILEMAGMEHDE